MSEQTSQLAKAVEAVSVHIPRIIVALATDELDLDERRTFGGLLIGLAELIHHHADDHTPPEDPNTAPARPEHVDPAAS